MVRCKKRCDCTHCGDTIYPGYWKSTINGFVVCSSCKFKPRLQCNDWLIKLAKGLSFARV